MKRKHLIIILALFAMVIVPFLAGNAQAVYLSDGSIQVGTTGLLAPIKNYCVAPPASWNGTGSIPNAVERDDLDMDHCLGSSADALPINGYAADNAAAAAAVATLNTQAACVAAGYNWSPTETRGGPVNQQPLTAGPVTPVTAGSCKAAFWSGDMPGSTGSSTTGKAWYTYGNDGCFRCHNAAYMKFDNGTTFSAKESYLMHGHRNMLRKVTAGENWAGPNGVVYTTDGTNTINFGTGTVTLASNHTTHQLFYIYGDWMIAAPSLVYNTTSDGVTSNGYTCAACHTTGYGNYANGAGVCTNFNKTTAATCTAAGGTWVYSTGVMGGGAFSATPTAAQPQATYPGITGITGNWDLDGILCSRCHNSGNTVKDASGNLVLSAHDRATLKGTAVTNMCFGCHQSVSSKNYSSPADTTGTVQTDPTQIGTGAGHGATYARDFNGHVIGNQFLNSPHGLYNGTMVPNELSEKDLSPTGTYASYFSASYGTDTGVCSIGVADPGGDPYRYKTYTSATCAAAGGTFSAEAGSCASCHDVHQSMFATSNPDGSTPAPIVRYCTTCHAGPYAQAAINHPSGTGTPLVNFGSDDASKSEACVMCHMSKQAVANGTLSSAMHVFRVNANASYNTFPTATQFYGGSCSINPSTNTTTALCTTAGGTWTAVTKQVMANTSPDGTYTNAVWVDIDNACGQCHGGDASTVTTSSAPYFTKAQLAGYAANIHNATTSPGFVHADFTWTQDTSVSKQVDFDASRSTCPSGTCTYAWSGAFTGTGITVSHAFLTGSAPYTVTLTVTDTASNSTGTKTDAGVTPKTLYTNLTPVLTASVSGFKVTVTDATTGNNGAITGDVMWGDGSADGSIATVGGTATYTYTKAGTYIIKYVVTDSAVDSAAVKIAKNTSVRVVVGTTQGFSISGTVENSASAAILNANATLSLLDSTGKVLRRTSANADGTFTFPPVAPGTYTIEAIGNALAGTPPIPTRFTFANVPVTLSNTGTGGSGIVVKAN